MFVCNGENKYAVLLIISYIISPSNAAQFFSQQTYYLFSIVQEAGIDIMSEAAFAERGILNVDRVNRVNYLRTRRNTFLPACVLVHHLITLFF